MFRQRRRLVHWTGLTVCLLSIINASPSWAQLQLPPSEVTSSEVNLQSSDLSAGANASNASSNNAINQSDIANSPDNNAVVQPATAPPANASPAISAPAIASPVPLPPSATTPTTPTPPTIGLTSELITSRLEQIQRTTEIEAAIKDALVPLYQRTLVDLKSANDASRLRKELAGRQAAAPKTLADAKQKKENQPPRVDDPSLLDYISFDELQQELQTEQSKLTAATELRTKLSEQVDTREKRRKELPQLISEAKTKQEQIDREQAAPPGAATVDPLLKEATVWSLMAQKMAASEQVQLLEQEQRVYEAETELLPLQLELARADEKYLQEQVRRLTEQLDRLRQEGIAQERQEVIRLVEEIPQGPDVPADLPKLGAQLMDRINQWLDLVKKKAEITNELNGSKALLEKWKDRYTKMVNRVEPQPGQDVVAGFNSWVGLMLRKQRNELPDTQKLERQIHHYQQEAQDVDAMLFTLEDALQTINSWSDDGQTSFTSNLLRGGDDSSTMRSDVSNDLRPTYDRLLAKDKELIEKMKIDIDTYLNNLYQVADLKTQTNAMVSKYHSFIEKHVLWIRSSEQLDKSDFREAANAFHWLVSYEHWRHLGALMLLDARQRPWWWVLFLVGFLTVLVNHTRMRRMLAASGDRACKRSNTSFHLTTQSLLLTIAISLPVPLVMLFLHWRLRSLDDTSEAFHQAIAHGLLVAAAVFTPFEFLRQMCRPGGLGVKHFEWSEAAAKLLTSNLRWLIDLATPIAMLVGVMEGQSNTRYQSSLGRLAFLVLMTLILAFSARVFIPRNGVFTDYLRQYRGGWLDRLRWGWYPLIVFSPILLAALSFIGFHYTSERLALHLHSSFWSLVGLILMYSLMRRWLLLSRRKIMVDQAKQRLAEAARRDPSQTVSASAGASDESELNLSAINEQTMRLVTSFMIVSGLVAFSVIWSDVLPAIGMLENFELWDVQGSKPNEVVTITLANLVIVVPIFILTVIAGRNLPGLMEIALLQHLPLTGAARYAISTLSRYAILILGIVASSSAIGLRWSSIQWLVAALGVGLGFGLQEIFANFVSGIILLFEQPIRVGDVITIDGVTGSVSKIRMRATTLVNWDRQELIIPNKDLITGKLLNWTLSDTTNRIQIRVGVTHGSDTEEACRILKEIVAGHANIMKDPASSVVFDNFGEGSLDLTIRAFLANLDVRLDTMHELHTQIYRRFAAAGIDIAFPQRDLHIRSFPLQMLQSLASRNGHGSAKDAVSSQ
ncbi:MAG: mechanosensitive ion channel [Pirellulaceae bacterium]|nr:mechanosensitive ion channel [Pirellulaceae bacterium]